MHRTVKRDKRTVRQTIPLIHSSLDLWTQGSAYPPPGTDILHLPFRFRLSDNIPPSFHYRAWQKSAYVFYELSAVGVRPGTFQFNRKQRMPLAVVPKDEVGVQLRERIPSLGWRKGEKVEKIRKGLWGDYATVHVEVSISPSLRVHRTYKSAASVPRHTCLPSVHRYPVHHQRDDYDGALVPLQSRRAARKQTHLPCPTRDAHRGQLPPLANHANTRAALRLRIC